MNQKKIAATVAIILVLALILSLALSAFGSAQAVTQSEIDALKQQQGEISKKKDELKEVLGAIGGELSEATQKKQTLDEQNELARQEIELIDEQIELYEKLIEKKAEELEEAKEVEAEQKEALRVRMRAMEENGKLSYFSILFNASSFTEFLSMLDDINMIMEYDKDLEQEYIEARETVEEVKAEYEATQEENEKTKGELEEKKAALEVQIEEANQVIVALEADMEEAEKQYDAKLAEEQALRSQVDTLIKQLEEQQKQQQQQNPGVIIPSGSGTFMWPLPSSHYISSPFGYRIHPISGKKKLHAGTDIGGTQGAPILAADSGTVVLAAYNGGYGNCVSISHGGGNSTLYGHMSAIAVSAGQAVNKGDVIGYVGSTGYSTGPHLHFEVKIGGQLCDPMSFF